MKSGFTSNTSIPVHLYIGSVRKPVRLLRVTPVSSYTSILACQYTSHTSIPVIPVYQPASIPVIVVSRSHQYTSHTSLPACQYTGHSRQSQLPVYQSYQYTSAVIPTLPLWMSVPYESTPLAAVCMCEESSPLAAVIVVDHICTHRPCANWASRTSITWCIIPGPQDLLATFSGNW